MLVTEELVSFATLLSYGDWREAMFVVVFQWDDDFLSHVSLDQCINSSFLN